MEGWVVAYVLSGSLEKAGQVSGESWSKNQRSPQKETRPTLSGCHWLGAGIGSMALAQMLWMDF